jgi:hypothetical protein
MTEDFLGNSLDFEEAIRMDSCFTRRKKSRKFVKNGVVSGPNTRFNADAATRCTTALSPNAHFALADVELE